MIAKDMFLQRRRESGSRWCWSLGHWNIYI